jgi:hypothetical protein
MTVLLFGNNSQSTLAQPLTTFATTGYLIAGGGALFPTPSTGQGFKMTFNDQATGLLTEIVLVTGLIGDEITSMLRSQEGTTAQAWNIGDFASNYDTAGTLDNFVQEDQLQTGSYSFAAITGSDNSITATLTSQLTALPTFIQFYGLSTAANTGAVTLTLVCPNFTSSTLALTKANGTALESDDIPAANYPLNVIYNSATNKFNLLNPSS